jgi:Holliday junction resolvasome RuvABC endonuclease subunit
VKFSLFDTLHPNIMSAATVEGKKGASTKKRSLQMVKHVLKMSNHLGSIAELEGVQAHLIEDYADALGIAMSVYWQAKTGAKVGDKRSAYQKRPKRKRQCIDISL